MDKATTPIAARPSDRRYAALQGRITAADAESENPNERLYTPAEESLPSDLPDVRKATKHAITISTTVEHRGRTFTIQAEGVTLDQFCDLLDQRGYTAAQQTQEWQRLPDGTPICPKHHAPMRKRERQGDTWYSHNVAGEGEAPIYCKGYHGKDSPGYES